MTVKLIVIGIVFILLILLVAVTAYFYGRMSAYRDIMEEDLDAAWHMNHIYDSRNLSFVESTKK